MKKYLGIYLPMLVGGFVGWFLQHFMGIGGCMGMTAGAAVWLAYELRLNTHRAETDMRLMQKDLEWMRKDWDGR